MTTDEAQRLGWSITRGPNRSVWIATRYDKVVFEPTRQRLLREIKRLEMSRLAPGS